MQYFLVLCYSVAKLGQGLEKMILIPYQQYIQLKYLKQALCVPYSTPNVVVYLEMALLPMAYVIDIRQFVYLHHILMLTNDEHVKNLYYQQL